MKSGEQRVFTRRRARALTAKINSRSSSKKRYWGRLAAKCDHTLHVLCSTRSLISFVTFRKLCIVPKIGVCVRETNASPRQIKFDARKTVGACRNIRLARKFVVTCAKYHTLIGAERRRLLMFIHHIIKGVEATKYTPPVFTTVFDRTINAKSAVSEPTADFESAAINECNWRRWQQTFLFNLTVLHLQNRQKASATRLVVCSFAARFARFKWLLVLL